MLGRSYPASTLQRPCPTPARAATPRMTSRPFASPGNGSPPSNHASLFRRAVPNTPADRDGASVDDFPSRAAFPVTVAGRHPHQHFRGLLRLHLIPARRIAQPPKATFVTRLQSGQSPSQTARQLPDPSTSIRVEPSSTRETRQLGAHGDGALISAAHFQHPRRRLPPQPAPAPTSLVEQISVRTRCGYLQPLAGNAVNQEPIRLQVKVAPALPISFQGMIAKAREQRLLGKKQVDCIGQLANVFAAFEGASQVPLETPGRGEPKSFSISAVPA